MVCRCLGGNYRRSPDPEHYSKRLCLRVRQGSGDPPTLERADGICQQNKFFKRPSAGSRETPDERGDRGGIRPLIPRILQPAISSTEERWGEQAGYRPVGSESIASHPKVQNGDFGLHSSGDSTGRMDHFHRPKRRLLPHTDQSVLSEVSEVLSGGQGVSVQGSAFWTGSRPLCLYKGSEGSGSLRPHSRGPGTHVSRRLASPRDRESFVETTYTLATAPLRGSGANSQCTEIELGTAQGFRVPRNSIPNRSLPLSTLSGQMEETFGHSSEIHHHTSTDRSIVDAIDRYVDLPGHSGSLGSTTSETHTVEFPRGLEQKAQVSLTEDSCVFSGQSPSLVVGQTFQCNAREVFDPVQSGGHGFHRCILGGVGRSYKRPYSSGSVAPAVEVTTHKLARVGGHQESTGGFHGSSSEQTRVDYVRQQNCCRLYQQTGGSQIQETVCSGADHIAMVSQDECEIEVQAHSRLTQCEGRLAQPQVSGDKFRMVTSPSGRSGDLEVVGQTACGLICHERQLQNPDICLPVPGRNGMGGRRSVDSMGRNVGLCFPPISANSQSLEKDQRGRGGNGSSSTLVARKGVVSRVVGSQLRQTLAASHQGEVAGSAKVKCVPRKSKRSPASRLETIAQGVRAKGFSADVAQRIARGKLRDSSLNVYEGRWNIFAKWCARRKSDPWQSSIQLIADFLLHLFEEGKLKVRTIEGYRAAISGSLKLKGLTVGSDPYLSNLIASFYIDRPVEPNWIPQWDLSIVLSALALPPFEIKDMSSVQLKFLTFKTVFLISLASGARRGEIHALDLSRTRWSDKGHEVFLRPYVGFLPKTYLARDPSTALQGFRIRSLSKGLDRSDPDRLLCPLRALRYYIKHTASLRAGNRSLFIPIKGTPSKKVCPNTISSWLKQCIRLAYQIVGQDDALQRLHSVRAHEVRALSSSWDALKSVAMSEIMAACRWRSHNTFSSFYLRDLVEVEEKLLAFKMVPTASSSRL